MKKYNITLFPFATPEKPFFAKNGEREELTLIELHDKIQTTSWSPSTFTYNQRNNENFEQCQIIALDFDGELTLPDAEHRLREQNWQYSITLSKSHQIDKNGLGPKDRFRVIIPLTSPIKDSRIYDATWKSVHQIFPEIDEQCKDTGRFYYNSPKAHSINLDGTTIDPVTKIEVQRKTPMTDIKNKPGEKVILGTGALLFIRNAHTGMPGSWNKALYVAAKECARGGFKKAEAETLLESMSPNPFDAADKKAFLSGWVDGEKAGPYKSLEKISKKEFDEEFYEFAEEELAELFHVMADEAGRRGIILKQQKGGIVTKSSREEVTSILGTYAKEHFGQFMTAREARNHADNFIMYTEPLAEEPKTVVFKDDKSLAYHKLDFKPEAGPCPLFEEMINRTTNPEALKAFIWSLFLPGSDRQQYIWLCGEGGNGKTSLQRFLERCLGSACVEKRVSSIHGNRFFTHSLIGKRLAVFSDTNSSTVVRSETIKEITGGGRIEVEPKGESPFTIKLDTKLMFISNNDPDISSKNADLRRLIMCKMDPLPKDTIIDSSYPEKLWSERSAILAECKKVYESLNVNGGSIPYDRLIAEDIAEESEVPMEAIFDEFLIEDKESFLTPVQLHRLIDKELKRAKINKKDFLEYMERHHLVRKRRRTIDDKRITVFNGIRTKV